MEVLSTLFRCFIFPIVENVYTIQHAYFKPGTFIFMQILYSHS